jgi:hypothetical protein
VREVFPTVDTSEIEEKMRVHVKWICASGALGGPQEMDQIGDVLYTEKKQIVMRSAGSNAFLYLPRAWIYEWQELER